MANDFSKSDNKSKLGIFIKATIWGLIITFIFMLLFSAAVLFLDLDRAYATPLSTISIASGSLAASYYAAKKIGDRGYLIGILVGIVVFVLITVLSLIINRSGFSANTAFHFVIILLSSTVGGILGVNKGKNKKYI